MTPTEKAEKLVEKFRDFTDPNYHECAEQWELVDSIKQNAKQCALIAVDEIQEHAQMITGTYEGYGSAYLYFIKVKEEIAKI